MHPAHDDEASPLNPSAAELTRRSIPLFDALEIAAMPGPSDLPVKFDQIETAALSVLIFGREAAPIDGGELCGSFEAVLTSLRVEAPPALAKMRFDDGRAAHDAYFRIRRVTGPAPARILLAGALRANILFLREVFESGTSIEAVYLDAIDEAFATFLALLVGRTAPSRGRVRSWPAASNAAVAMQRWVRGHQLFTILTQALVLAVNGVKAALDGARANADAHLRVLDAAVGQVVILMRGSAAALRLTGDFSAADYCAAIRPTMQPPHVPEGFSGILSIDHQLLIARMQKMRPGWERLRTEAPAIHDRLSATLDQLYDDHKHVCSRFVGSDKPSLISTSTPACKAAVDQLQQFKIARLKTIGAVPTRTPPPIS